MQDYTYGWYCLVELGVTLWLVTAITGFLKNKAILLGEETDADIIVPLTGEENNAEVTLTRIKVGLYFAVLIGPYLMIIGEFSTLNTLLGIAAICLSLGGIGLCDLALKELESNFVTKVAIICFMGTGLISLGGTFLPYPSAQWWGQRVDLLEKNYSTMVLYIVLGTVFLLVLLLQFHQQGYWDVKNPGPDLTDETEED